MMFRLKKRGRIFSKEMRPRSLCVLLKNLCLGEIMCVV